MFTKAKYTDNEKEFINYSFASKVNKDTIKEESEL